MKHGKFISYDEKNEVTSEGEFKQDKKVGSWVYYFALSKQIQVHETYYDNGKLKSKKEFTQQNKLIRDRNLR